MLKSTCLDVLQLLQLPAAAVGHRQRALSLGQRDGAAGPVGRHLDAPSAVHGVELDEIRNALDGRDVVQVDDGEGIGTGPCKAER